jgi:hypothetical protein
MRRRATPSIVHLSNGKTKFFKVLLWKFALPHPPFFPWFEIDEQINEWINSK